MRTSIARVGHIDAPPRPSRRSFHIYLMLDSIRCCLTERRATARGNLKGLRRRGGIVSLAGFTAHDLASLGRRTRESMTLASASSKQRADDYGRFAIGFDHRDRARFHALIDEVLDSERWSEADMVARFEAAWTAWNGAPAVAVSSW